MKRLWRTVDYFSCSSLEGLRNVTIHFSQDKQRPGWESNQAYSDYCLAAWYLRTSSDLVQLYE